MGVESSWTAIDARAAAQIGKHQAPFGMR